MKSAIGLSGAFFAGICMELVGFLYVLFMVRETVQDYTSGLGELFDFQHVRNSVSAVFKKRQNVNSWHLWGLLLSHAFVMAPTFGTNELAVKVLNVT